MLRGAALFGRVRRMTEKPATVSIFSGSADRSCPYGHSVWDAVGSSARRRGLFFDDQAVMMEESSPGHVHLLPVQHESKEHRRPLRFGRAAPSLPDSVTLGLQLKELPCKSCRHEPPSRIDTPTEISARGKEGQEMTRVGCPVSSAQDHLGSFCTLPCRRARSSRSLPATTGSKCKAGRGCPAAGHWVVVATSARFNNDDKDFWSVLRRGRVQGPCAL